MEISHVPDRATVGLRQLRREPREVFAALPRGVVEDQRWRAADAQGSDGMK